jgi:hypothetical protein
MLARHLRNKWLAMNTTPHGIESDPQPVWYERAHLLTACSRPNETKLAEGSANTPRIENSHSPVSFSEQYEASPDWYKGSNDDVRPASSPEDTQLALLSVLFSAIIAAAVFTGVKPRIGGTIGTLISAALAFTVFIGLGGTMLGVLLSLSGKVTSSQLLTMRDSSRTITENYRT